MKNTRRFISAVTALTLVSALAPVSAFAIPAEPNNITEVKYSAAASYMVTIPAKVTLTDSAATTAPITVSGQSAEKPFKLAKDQKVVVSLDDTETNDFKVYNNEAYATYTVKSGESTDALAAGDVAAEFAAAGTQNLSFEVADTTHATYAGEYTGTLTFNIALKPPATINLTVDILNDQLIKFGEVAIPVSYGAKWSDIATYIPDADFGNAFALFEQQDTSTYPANTLYYNPNGGVYYYTSNALFLICAIIPVENANPKVVMVAADDEMTDSATYFVFPMLTYD